MSCILRLGWVLACSLFALAPGSAWASAIYYSDRADNTGASPTFLDGDVLADDTAGGLADHSIFFSETLFSANEDIDAFHGLGANQVLLSTTGRATLGGLTFNDEDVVRYDFALDVATIFFDGSSVFTANEDVDGFHVLDDGRLLLSTAGDAEIGGLAFEDEDVVVYDPTSGAASLFFEGDLHFAADEEIDAIAYDAISGSLLFSTGTNAELAGTIYADGDVIAWDGVAFREYYTIEDLPGRNDLDALSLVPEPTTAVLMGLGLGLLARRR